MAHNSRQDKFIRYFRLDCAALGQKLRLELANRKLVPRNASRVAEKFHRECSFNCETWKLLFDFSVFFFLLFLFPFFFPLENARRLINGNSRHDSPWCVEISERR